MERELCGPPFCRILLKSSTTINRPGFLLLGLVFNLFLTMADEQTESSHSRYRKDQRITGWARLEKPLEITQSNSSSQAILFTAMPSQLLSISKDGESTPSLGYLWKCAVILTIKKCFQCFSLCSVSTGYHSEKPDSLFFTPSPQV